MPTEARPFRISLAISSMVWTSPTMRKVSVLTKRSRKRRLSTVRSSFRIAIGMCLTSLSSAYPNAIISMSGGKSMKNNVIGSRRTVMNSLNRIAFRPRKGARFMSRSARKSQIPNPKLQRSPKSQAPNGKLSPSRRFFLVILVRVFRRQRYEHIFQRRADLVNLGTRNTDAAQLCVDLRALHAFVDQQVHRLAEHRC